MTRRATTSALCVAAISGAVAVPLLFGGTDVFASLASFPAWAAAAIAALVISSWFAKGLKFCLLSRRIGRPAGLVACTAVALGSDFAFVATPAGVGGYAATAYLCDRIGMTTGAAAALTAADQVLDLLFFALTVPLAVLWLLAQGIRADIDFAGVAIVLATAALGAMVLRASGWAPWKAAARMVVRLPWLRRRRDVLRRLCNDTLAHLRDLRSAPRPYLLLIMAVTSAQWLTRYAVLGVALAGFGHRAPAAAVLLLQSVALHAGQLTGVPGGIGGADLIIAQSLCAWVPQTAIGGALLVWRAATFYLTLLAGGLVFACLALLPRNRAAVGAGTTAS